MFWVASSTDSNNGTEGSCVGRIWIVVAEMGSEGHHR